LGFHLHCPTSEVVCDVSKNSSAVGTKPTSSNKANNNAAKMRNTTKTAENFSGWLLKLGKFNKVMKRRYFVLKDNELSYYENEAEVSIYICVCVCCMCLLLFL
jgi:hypothetical protein